MTRRTREDRMRSRRGGARGLLAACALAALVGCGGTRPTMGTSLTPDVIYQDEIDASSATNAYDLVQEVRPNWLRGRGTHSLRSSDIELPVVYVEDRRQGALEVLRSYQSKSIAELRFINATTATTRWGNGHGGGVIQVLLRRY